MTELLPKPKPEDYSEVIGSINPTAEMYKAERDYYKRLAEFLGEVIETAHRQLRANAPTFALHTLKEALSTIKGSQA